REQLSVATVLGRRVPHRPCCYGERQHPGPSRDGSRRLHASRFEYVAGAALVGVHQDRDTPLDDLTLAQSHDSDARAVANSKRNLLKARRPFAAGRAHAQHMRTVREMARVELELTRRLEGGAGLALVVDEDVNPHRESFSSSRMRHFTWSREVSPGCRV